MLITSNCLTVLLFINLKQELTTEKSSEQIASTIQMLMI